jgi:hypothetical protein
MWKEAPIAYFKVLSWYLPGGTEENNKKPQSRYSLSWPRFELETSQMHGGSITA